MSLIVTGTIFHNTAADATFSAAGATAWNNDHTITLVISGTLAASDVTGLATVATTGAYGDLTGVPTSFTPVGSALTSGNLWLGSAGNVAAAVAMSGDGTISNAGVLTVSKMTLTVEPSVDQTAVGPNTSSLNAGGSITIMDLVILNSSSQWVQTDANASATYAGMLAISLQSKTSGQAMSVATKGAVIRNDAWNWTPGATLYMSETAAAITATQPTTTDAAIRVVGFALTDDCIYFDPSPDYVTHT